MTSPRPETRFSWPIVLSEKSSPPPSLLIYTQWTGLYMKLLKQNRQNTFLKPHPSSGPFGNVFRSVLHPPSNPIPSPRRQSLLDRVITWDIFSSILSFKFHSLYVSQTKWYLRVIYTPYIGREDYPPSVDRVPDSKDTDNLKRKTPPKTK